VTPSVTVVIPVYNGARYLAEAIDSIGADPPVEVIVVDDGSEDDSAAVAARHERVRLIRQEHAGVGAARNRGIAAAGCSWIAFLDADDLWGEGKLRHQLAAFAASPTLDIASCLVEEFISPDLTPAERAGLTARPGRHPAPLPSTLLFRREVADRIGGFGGSTTAGGDLDWQLRARDASLEMAPVTTAVVYRRLHGSNSGRVTRPDQHAEYLRALKRSIDRRRRGASQ
jgi:glycosyltransferase involved in cell wall biosynthesis